MQITKVKNKLGIKEINWNQNTKKKERKSENLRINNPDFTTTLFTIRQPVVLRDKQDIFFFAIRRAPVTMGDQLVKRPLFCVLSWNLFCHA